MKKIIIILLFLLIPAGVYASWRPFDFLKSLFIESTDTNLGATILPPFLGGTGTSTPPQIGQILLGNSIGKYDVANLVNGGGVVFTFATNTLTIAASSSASGVSDWQKEKNFGVLALTPTTTIPLWAKDAIYASSTLTVNGAATFNTINATSTLNVTGAAGIGTSTSGIKFAIQGDSYTSGTSTVGGLVATGTVFVSGGMGINKTNPTTTLDVVGVIRASDGLVAQAGSNLANTVFSNYLEITGGYGRKPATGNYLEIGAGGAGSNAGSVAWGDNTGWLLNFGTDAGGVFTPRVTFVDTGRVGIGSTTPGALLSVHGNSLVSGTSTSGGIFATGTVMATDLVLTGNASTSGLTIYGQATTTASNGFNILGGCFSIKGTCVSGGAGGGITSLNLLAGAAQTFSTTNNEYSTLTITSAGTDHAFYANGTTSPTFGSIRASSTVNITGNTLIANASTTIINLKTSVSTTTNYMDFVGVAQPATPGTGVVRLHALTTQGITRLEQHNGAISHITLSRDNVFIAKNTSGAAIAAGLAVYVTGSTGAIPNIALALANSTSTLPAVGIVLDAIADGSFGQVMKLGLIDSINTSAFTTGDRLFVSTVTPGTLVNIRPEYPNFVQRIGSVLNSGVGNGSILVQVAPFIGSEESGTKLNAFTIGGTGFATTTLSNSISSFAGKLGIGTTSPLGKISIASLSTDSDQISPLFMIASDTRNGVSTTLAMWRDGTMAIGVGTSTYAKFTISNNKSPVTPPALGPILHLVAGDNDNPSMAMDTFKNPVGFIVRRANGSATNPTAVQSGDVLAQFQGRGYGSTKYSPSVNVGMTYRATQNWTDALQGAAIDFYTGSNTGVLNTAVTFDQSGFLGVGTSSPGKTLAVNGAMGVNGLPASTAGNAVCILNNFEFVNAGGTTCVTSSIKTKKETTPITSEDASNTILSLLPSEYTNKEGGDRRYGFIAEWTNNPLLIEYATQGQKFIDGTVIAKGEPRGFDYLRYPAILTKFVQDLYADFQKLIARITGLENRLTDQQNRIDAQQIQIDNLTQLINNHIASTTLGQAPINNNILTPDKEDDDIIDLPLWRKMLKKIF